MHDLDILAESGYFHDGSKIPELPFVGILFAKKIVAEFYKLFFFQRSEIRVFLDDTLEVLTKVNLPPEQRFFSGNAIGYNEYKLRNGKIYLTALEQKSWLVFLNFLSLKPTDDVSPAESTSVPFYQTLKTKLESMTKEDFSNFDNHKQCFTII